MADAPSLVCIGNLTIDEAVSPAGERVESVGGDALFAALAARLAGGNPTILAPLGTDATPALLAAIRSAGTDPATLPRRELPTIRNVIHYDDAGGPGVGPGPGRGALRGAVGASRRRRPTPRWPRPESCCRRWPCTHSSSWPPWLRPRTAATIYFDPQEDYIAGNEAALLRRGPAL